VHNNYLNKVINLEANKENTSQRIITISNWYGI